MIIGLTGEHCAGKGTLAEYLKKKSFYYLSLSDVIREEIAAEGKEITRDALIEKGNELRKEFGPGVLAKKSTAKIKDDRNYVIDSIMNPAEVKELRKLKGFVLVHVTAPPEMRFERMRARGRESDPRTYDAFLKVEKAEMKNIDITKHQQQETSRMADKTIINDSDLNGFYEKIDVLLGEISKEFRPVKPGWDEYFINIAKVVSTRSNCMKRHIGAIIVRDKRIISTGYNGTPRGIKNCDEGGCPRCNNFADKGTKLDECICSHGEENAIVQAAYHGISIKGSTIYTTFSPCWWCTKMIINSGIVEVVYNADYPLGEVPLQLLKEAGVMVKQLKMD
jgi:dCMP deaminase